MKNPAHEATTRHLSAAYPFMAEPGLGLQGSLVGRDLLGGAFRYDPFAAYRQGLVTNPNIVVLGQIGRGKSSFVKTFLWRQSALGRRAWVVDPKGEYVGLARAWGVSPVALRPGGPLRLNPLDASVQSVPGAHEETTRRRAELLASLAAASLGRVLLPSERAAIDVALGELGARRGHGTYAPLLPDVVETMLHPSRRAATALGTDLPGLAADGRNVALELRRLVSGDLRGMFDGPTSDEISLDTSLVVLDLSAVYQSTALGILMTCAAAWLQAGLIGERDGAAGMGAAGMGTDKGTIVVVDEAWAILSNMAVARWLQRAWKLSRAWGVSNVAVVHRISDFDAAGSSTSEQRGLAQGLLADSETRVVYAQPPGEIERASEVLGLSETETELVPLLGRARALWKVGQRSFLVEHKLSPFESALIDTDTRMDHRPLVDPKTDGET